MINNKKVLALITARSGSKGLKGKNTIDLDGKPLIAWPITTALNSKYVDKVLLSTDSKKIADIGKKYGALIPFLRPKKLASDTASSMSVVLHAVNFLHDQKDFYDYIILLEPTSPLTLSDDIDKALLQLEKKKNYKFQSIVSISKSESTHPNFCSTIHSSHSNHLKPFLREKFSSPARRQDLSDVYFFDGSFYISRTNYFLQNETFFHDYTLGFEMPQWQSYEIDSNLDLHIIKAILETKREFYV